MMFVGRLLAGHFHTMFYCKIKLMANKIPKIQNAFKLNFKYSYKRIFKVSDTSKTCNYKFLQ